MRNFCALLVFSAFTFFSNAQTVYTIGYSGFSFTPDLVTCRTGDIVRFNLNSSHPVTQVSESTWNANGNTSLSGGFSFPSGAGDYIPSTAGTFYFVCIPHASLGMKGRIVVEAATGLNEIKHNNDFMVYPNPVNEQLNIYLSKAIRISEIHITDLTGRNIISIKEPVISDNEFHLNINSMVKGVYFVTLVSDHGRMSAKFIRL